MGGVYFLWWDDAVRYATLAARTTGVRQTVRRVGLGRRHINWVVRSR